LLADKACDADERVISLLENAGKTPVIPSKSNRKVLRDYGNDLYKERHLIENCFAALKQYRAIATRYDKTARNFLVAVYLQAAAIWPKRRLALVVVAFMAPHAFTAHVAHVAAHAVVGAAAHHHHRADGVEGSALFGAQLPVEPLDGVGVALELGLLVGHVRGHPVHTVGHGHGAHLVTVAVHPHTAVFMARAGHGLGQGLEGGLLVGADVQNVVQRLGLSLGPLAHLVGPAVVAADGGRAGHACVAVLGEAGGGNA
jgi:transposase